MSSQVDCHGLPLGSGGDADVITVHIKTAEGAHLTLYEVNPHCSVLAIKEKVLVKWTISPSSQTLISPSGVQLHDDEQISECGITNDCELHLIRTGGGVPGPLHDGAPTDHCSQLVSLDLLRHLAAASCDVFEPGSFIGGGKSSLQLLDVHEFDGVLGWATYRFRGGVVLALMGTRNSSQQQQEAQLEAGGGCQFYQAKDAAIALGWELKPDYVVGHGLAGSLAQCICSYCSIPGAAFGPFGLVGTNGPMGYPNLADGRRHVDVAFKVVASHTDWVTYLPAADYAATHIVKPEHIQWVRDLPDDRGAKAMLNYVRELGELP